MSETTNKMRDVAIYSDSLIRVRDLAADAIEAVEAQVAEAVARVAALEKRGIDAQGGNRSGESPAGKLAPTGSSESGLGTDRGASSAPASPPAPSAVPAPELWHRATQGFVSSTLPTDMWPHEPPSSAFAAPRGFRVGDRVRPVWSPNEPGWRINDIDDEGLVYVKGWTRARRSAAWRPSSLTLVRAADAPEAPAEDAGLVERLARIIVDTPCAANHEGQCIPPGAPVDDCDRANARAVLSDLTAESRLCAPGEVARLKDELAEANGARFLNANAVRLQKARAEAAEKELAEARAISAATAERVRNETQIATELRKDLADANGARDRLVRELSGERVERDYWKTRAEDVTKERDALRAELDTLKAKPRFRTRKVTAADVRALDDEWAKSKYVGRDSWVRAMRKLGFRRRVEQSK